MKTIQLASISVIHSTWLPYATGCIISHCMKDERISGSHKFLSPWYEYKPIEEYESQFDDIDVLGLTCYVWNQSYNDKLSSRYKSVNPNGVVIYGGPNVPGEQDVAFRYAKSRPFVDLFFVGPGEINFANWLADGLLEGTFSSTHFSVGDTKKYQLKDAPTPYTDGVFDQILSTADKVKASFETNRGCPYACAFCDWGGQAQSKLIRFDRDEVYKQIEHIYKHKNVHEIEILDANFGIVADDISTVDFMISMQEKHNNRILVSYSGLAKNGSKWLPRILSTVFEKLPIKQRNLKLSFQTHSTDTLEVIQRHTIDNTRLYPLIQAYKEQQVLTTSELIIALPGETANSWLDTLDTNHSLGIDYIRTYFLNLVANTPMYTKAYREKHGLLTKTLRFPYEFSGVGYDILHSDPRYSLHSSADQEEIEIVYQCNSFDLNELTGMFRYHWFYHNLINTDGIRPIVKNVREEARLFVSRLDDMPTLRNIVSDNIDIVKRIFEPTPVTNIYDLSGYFYFSRCMRADDVYRIWYNREQVAKELSLVYKSDDVYRCIDRWKDKFDYGLYGTDANLVRNNT